MVSLEAFGARRPGQLSGGQQQRVALARALVFEPSLVLMDEPLGALDKQLRERMQIEIKHLQTELGITMVYVTHDQSEALTMSDRIAVFHDGIIQQLADPKTLYRDPQNRFVAEFIGENNIIPCSLAGIENGRTVLRMADGTLLGVSEQPASSAKRDLAVSIRPEALSLADRRGQAGVNSITGSARDVFFLGDHLRLTVEAFGGQLLTARIPAHKARHFSPGEQVELECNMSECRLLED